MATKILMLTSVKHGGQEFVKDEQRIVDDKLAGYFCNNGWAQDLSGAIETKDPDKSDKTLDVHDSTIGHATSTPGDDNG